MKIVQKLVLIAALTASINNYCKTLDELAITYGTDKSSQAHGYTATYEKYFAPLREKSIKFLEIGFWRGYSAHMWEDYFSNAQLFFIDINKDALSYLKNFTRSNLFIVNQEDPIALMNFIQMVGGDFDIIIDDGGHTMNQQITSFKTLFPFLKRGGIYVIEDLHTSYRFGPNSLVTEGQETTVEFLQNLVDCVNKIGAQTGYAAFNKCSPAVLKQLSEYEKHIESIHFYTSLCFIIKR